MYFPTNQDTKVNYTMVDNTLHVHVVLTVKTQLYIQNNLDAVKKIIYNSGARFTEHLKPKSFVSSIQFVWNLRKS